MDPDRYLDRYLILETLPAGGSPRRKLLQQSKARSHASAVGRERAIFQRNALNNAPETPETRVKPRRTRAGVYRVGPSPQHVRRHVTNRTTDESFRSNTSPLPAPVELTHDLPRAVSPIPGSGYDGSPKQTSCEQRLRPLQIESHVEGQRIVQKTAKKSTSSSQVPSMSSFQLIQYNPMKPTPEITHAIRSNAVRYQWKRSKAVRPKGRKAKVPESPELSSQRATRTSQDRHLTESVQYAQDNIKHRSVPNKSRVLIKMPPLGRDSSLQPGGYPTELPSDVIAPLYHLVYEITNRAFVGNQVQTMSVMAGRYVQQMRSHPASFHAAVWVCAKGMIDRSSTNPSTRKHTRLLDLCHHIAVKSVIQMISDLSDCNYVAPPNALGMLCSAMQSLALGTTEDIPRRAGPSGPRQSTLTKLQNLNFWGTAPRWLNYHEEAARTILEANNSTDPFWAGLRICHTQNDISSACRALTKPRSPCGFLNANFADHYNRVMFQLKPKHSPGFMKYATTLCPALSGPLLSTISQLTLYDTIQAALLSNTLAWFGVECVCDARNWTQHQLMSLPSSEESAMLTKSIQAAAMFDAVRNALIVYSLIAVLPLPLATAPFPELAARLESGISQVLEVDQDAMSTSLLLWTSSMGALAAIGTPQRSALVCLTANFCRRLRIFSWESMQATLQDYLWSGDISDFDGIFLFLEVQKLLLEDDTGSQYIRP